MSRASNAVVGITRDMREREPIDNLAVLGDLCGWTRQDIRYRLGQDVAMPALQACGRQLLEFGDNSTAVPVFGTRRGHGGNSATGLSTQDA